MEDFKEAWDSRYVGELDQVFPLVYAGKNPEADEL